MKFLLFDTETNGLPKAYNASYTDVDNWPRVISIAWIIADVQANVLDRQHHLIKPDGWEMPTGDFWINNGFSQEKSLAEGVPILGVIETFMTAKHSSDVLVAHNLNFDHRIVWAEIIRAGLQPRSGMPKICTMMTSTKFCNIPGKRGPKWPKLEELHKVLFGKGFDGAHDALADITATKDCFFELVRLGVIELPELSQAQDNA